MVCKAETRNEERAGASRKAAEDADENQISSPVFSWKLDLFFLYNCQPDSRISSTWPEPALRFGAGISVAPVRLAFPGPRWLLRAAQEHVCGAGHSVLRGQGPGRYWGPVVPDAVLSADTGRRPLGWPWTPCTGNGPHPPKMRGLGLSSHLDLPDTPPRGTMPPCLLLANEQNYQNRLRNWCWVGPVAEGSCAGLA